MLLKFCQLHYPPNADTPIINTSIDVNRFSSHSTAGDPL